MVFFEGVSESRATDSAETGATSIRGPAIGVFVATVAFVFNILFGKFALCSSVFVVCTAISVDSVFSLGFN